MNPLYADANSHERLGLVSEYKLAFTAYLETHLGRRNEHTMREKEAQRLLEGSPSIYRRD